MKGKFFESIKLFDGQLYLLPYHEKRMQATQSFFYEVYDKINLSAIVKIPEACRKGLYKCRVSYDKVIRDITFQPYKPAEASKVLLLEIGNVFDYTFKFEDRVFFQDALRDNPDVDDVLFLSNGLLTDCTYSNVVLHNGDNWVTPKTRLLSGVKRQYCLDNKVIVEKDIHVDELSDYSKVAFLNALRDFEIVYEFEVIGDKLLLKLVTT